MFGLWLPVLICTADALGILTGSTLLRIGRSCWFVEPPEEAPLLNRVCQMYPRLFNFNRKCLVAYDLDFMRTE
jgi:hypothetical protein